MKHGESHEDPLVNEVVDLVTLVHALPVVDWLVEDAHHIVTRMALEVLAHIIVLDAYLDELEWRFNNRDNPYLFRDTLKRLVQSENLEYKVLIGEGTSS